MEDAHLILVTIFYLSAFVIMGSLIEVYIKRGQDPSVQRPIGKITWGKTRRGVYVMADIYIVSLWFLYCVIPGLEGNYTPSNARWKSQDTGITTPVQVQQATIKQYWMDVTRRIADSILQEQEFDRSRKQSDLVASQDLAIAIRLSEDAQRRSLQNIPPELVGNPSRHLLRLCRELTETEETIKQRYLGEITEMDYERRRKGLDKKTRSDSGLVHQEFFAVYMSVFGDPNDLPQIYKTITDEKTRQKRVQ